MTRRRNQGLQGACAAGNCTVHSVVVLKSGSWPILAHEQELLSMGKPQTHHFVLSLYIRFPKCFKGTPARTEVERG